MSGRFTEPILHVDMDAFFVEVERRRRSELRGSAVVVGGDGPRAVVASASYEAREFGVTSAMPMVEARRRCPGVIVVPPDHDAYRSMSARVFELLRAFTPRVEALSIDEAFLDIGGLRLHFANPAAVAAEIRRRMRDELGLPASVGGGANKLVAKLASEDAKPDGLHIVPAGTEPAFLHPMPVRRLWGVGEATMASLQGLGVSTVGELAAVSPGTLVQRLGATLGRHLGRLAHGCDERRVDPGSGAKTISVEETYDRDLCDERQVADAVLAQCGRLSARLTEAGLATRTITLKVRFADFTTITRSASVRHPIYHTPDLGELAGRLLARVGRRNRAIRLLGVGASSLVLDGARRQLSFEHSRRDAAADAAARVRKRFGRASLIPARLAPQPDVRNRSGDVPGPGNG